MDEIKLKYSREEFFIKFKNKYIKCYTMDELAFIITNYAYNKVGWAIDLNDPNFIEKSVYNLDGLILKIHEDESIYRGYYDRDVAEFIEISEIINKNDITENNNKMNEITEILEGIYNDSELRKTIVPLFISNPGHNKTRQIEAFAKSKGAKLVEIISSQVSPFEVSGICIPSHTKEKMVYYDFDRIDDLVDGDILYFDELLAGNPTTLAACLTLIEQRRTISGKALPDILIVAAANPQNQTPISPAIKERFVWYYLKFEKYSYIQYLIEKYNITRTIGDKLCNLITNEQFIGGENFMSPRSVDKAINMIIKKVPTPYKSKILPILEELVLNSSENTIMIGDQEFLPNESKKWIDIYRLMNNIK